MFEIAMCAQAPGRKGSVLLPGGVRGEAHEEVLMTVHARVVEYYCTCVEDKPGEGYRLLARLKRHEVNFLAFTSFPSGPGQVQLNFFPEDHEELLGAAKELNVTLLGPRKAFLITGDDRVGALADVFRRFYDADINMLAANCVADDRGGYGLIVWVAPPDCEEAARALGIVAKPEAAASS